ncbi:DMT family transporter, partial [bacterium]|nr:DMT family transporter [candidate division CSSED10-310 bacterium]
MKRFKWKYESLLILTAAIWGFAFIAQRAGMEHVGPFTFNAVRFAMGSLVLVPLILVRNRRVKSESDHLKWRKIHRWGPVLAGLVLFLGASLQQVGIVFTTAGKAGFITGLYVILVPIFGLFQRQVPRWGTWTGAILAVAGLYLLSFSGSFTMSTGDLLVL